MVRVPHHKVRALAAIAEKMVRDMEHHPIALSLQGEVNRLRSAAEALDDLDANRNPLETAAAHTKKIATKAKALDREVTASINRLSAILRDGKQRVQQRIDQKVKLTPPPFEQAKEIREVFRSMKRQEQMELLKKLVEQNRGPELAAIIKGSELTSGLSDLERANFEKSIIGKHASAELDEMTAIEGVWEQGLTAANLTGSYVASLNDPGRVAEIERAEAAANAAGAAFDKSLQNDAA